MSMKSVSLSNILLVAAGFALGLWLCGCNGPGQAATPDEAATTTATAPGPATATAVPLPAQSSGPFTKLADFKVAGPVAEIVAATPDEKTLLYTDATGKNIGFVDLTDPAGPRNLPSLAVQGEPTSVAVTPNGRYALACVSAPADHLLVIDPAQRMVLRKLALPGQPDCIAISADGRFAAIAIENERTDMEKPMPQMPPGSLTIVDLQGAPQAWRVRNVALKNLPIRFPTDPEPEYIGIDGHNRAAVTLQENNGVAIVDLARGKVLAAWPVGTVSHAADLHKDGETRFTDQLTNARREPDSIAWTPNGNLITANEGDYDLDLPGNQYSGGRNWTIFSATGKVVWDAGATLEAAIAAQGLYNDKRSEKKGVEPEGAAVARYGKRVLAFIGTERANALAVYDIADEKSPQLLQILATGDKPEGIRPLPKRGLLVTGNEGDGTLSIFRLDTRR